MTEQDELVQSRAPEQSSPEISLISDTDFMREKIKQRPLNRGKLLRRTLLTVSLAVVFGLVACVTFLLLSPVINRMLNPDPVNTPDPVILPEEHVEDEVSPEDLIADETELKQGEDVNVQEVIDNYIFDVSDYNEMYASLKTIATESARSLVTVTAQQSGTDFSGETFETNSTVSGLIVADNGYSLLIVADGAELAKTEDITVTFHQGTTLEAGVLSRDPLTGLCILSVSHSAFPENNLSLFPVAALGTSSTVRITGTPVIAIGSPDGTPGSIVYGVVTGAGRTLRLVDANYSLLTTDILSHPAASGFLINSDGSVVGLISPSLTKETEAESYGVLCAYGISSVRTLIERLSNNRPRIMLGIYGTEIPASVRERESIPQGAYVSRIEMDSPAMDAGIQSGDVIIKLGEAEITSFSALSAALVNLNPGETVSVTLLRTGPDGYAEMQLDAVPQVLADE